MPNSDQILISYIIDRSGSMHNRWDEVRGGLKTYIEEQAKPGRGSPRAEWVRGEINAGPVDGDFFGRAPQSFQSGLEGAAHREEKIALAEQPAIDPGAAGLDMTG